MKDSLSRSSESQQDKIRKYFRSSAACRGLEAFTQLLQDLPTDTGMAFVLIQHLDPNYKSMSEILARTTQMPVYQVQAGMIVEPNQVCHSAQQEDDLGSGSATTCASRKDSWKICLLMRSLRRWQQSGESCARCGAVGARWRRALGWRMGRQVALPLPSVSIGKIR